MRLDDLVLVEQRQPAGRFQDPLDHEHDVGAAGVVFVEAERDVVLQRPRQNAVAEFGDLHAFADHDGVLADQIDAADVAVEIDAHAGPIEPRRHLLDMRRFAGAVIAGDDDAAIPGEAGENGERSRLVETIIGIDFGHVLVPARNRPALPNRCRCRTIVGSKPSCPASRIHCQLRGSLLLRALGKSEARLGYHRRSDICATSSRKAQADKSPVTGRGNYPQDQQKPAVFR